MTITKLPGQWPITKRIQNARDLERWYRFSAQHHRNEAAREEKIATRYMREAQKLESEQSA